MSGTVTSVNEGGAPVTVRPGSGVDGFFDGEGFHEGVGDFG